MASVRFVLALLAVTALLGGCFLFNNPILELSSTSLSLGENSWAPLEIRNTGGKTLAWRLDDKDAPGWLSAATVDGLTEGSLATGRSVTLYVVVSRSGIETSPGSYQGSLTIDSNVAAVEVSVRTNVPNDNSVDRCSGSGPPPLREAAPPLTDPPGDLPTLVPGQLLVRFRGDPAPSLPSQGALATAVAGEYGFTLLRTGAGVRSDLLSLPAGVDPLEAAARLNDDPRVLYAEPNHYLYPQELPNDPELSEQWSLCRFGLPQAWEITSGTSSGSGRTVIAIVDSGVDTDHEDLIAKMLPGHDFCTNSDCSTPPDDNPNSNDSHGTHVAGIAAAAGANGIGVAGVAYTGVGILPVKVFDNFGVSATVDSLANGILWAIGEDVTGQLFANANPARIINLSLGGDIDSQTLRDAVTTARNAGAIVVAASGNTGSGDATPHNGILAPADSPGALAVGSVNSNGQRSSFSMFDATGGPTVSLMAPGGRLLGASTSILNTFPNDTYGYQLGTSMATPFVAGVAALVWSAEPGLSDDQVIERLLTSTRSNASWNPLEYGAGILCADMALGRATTCGD